MRAWSPGDCPHPRAQGGTMRARAARTFASLWRRPRLRLAPVALAVASERTCSCHVRSRDENPCILSLQNSGALPILPTSNTLSRRRPRMARRLGRTRAHHWSGRRTRHCRPPAYQRSLRLTRTYSLLLPDASSGSQPEASDRRAAVHTGASRLRDSRLGQAQWRAAQPARVSRTPTGTAAAAAAAPAPATWWWWRLGAAGAAQALPQA